jgi:hypothetical protein
MRLTVDDRMNHPHVFSLVSAIFGGLFKYHQMNSWMTTDGIFEFFNESGEIIHSVVEKVSGYSSLRLSHETIDLYPSFVDGRLRIHDDCVPAGKCSDNLQLRMYLALDFIEAGQHLNYLRNDQRRMDEAWGSSDDKFIPRFIPAPELNPGDILMWDINMLHTAFHSHRRVITWSLMSGEEKLVPSTGMAWVGLFDPDVWEKQESVYYPIIYPKIEDEVIEARQTFSGRPTFRQFWSYVETNLNIRLKTECGQMFFEDCQERATRNHIEFATKALKWLGPFVSAVFK